MESYSILINTCDKFEDCWDPFFKLWSIYWPDCKVKVYLNTEYKDYSYTGLNIIPVKCCEGKQFKGKYASWSQCLLWALGSIDSDIILYMQEDYFLNGVVNNEMVEYYVQYIQNHSDVACIQLSTANIPNGEVFDLQFHLNYIDSNFFYYVSCQAALWRKDVLISLIRESESAWQFEYYASKRARYCGCRFLALNHEWLHSGNDIIPYIRTGIIRGKWYKPVVKLFTDNSIKIDYQIRGFYSSDGPINIWDRIQRRIRFTKLSSELEILWLRIKYIKERWNSITC